MSKKIPVSVLVVIHTDDMQILQLERVKHPGFWQSVTGSQEAGETLLQTACREVAEETGLTVSPADLIDWRVSNRYEIFLEWRHRYAEDITHNVEHLFSVCVPAAQAIRHAESEHRSSRWVSWREAIETSFSWSNRDAIYLLALSRGVI